MALGLSSCSTSRKGVAVEVSGRNGRSDDGQRLTVTPADKQLHASTQRLLAEAESWLGTPYKYGGNDREGVDCSGLVLQVYLRALGISLPRVSAEQKEFCVPTSKGSLHPGDLLFFATGRKKDSVSHVGIFIGENRMIHASSRGVMVSDIAEGYYAVNYAGAGYVEAYRAMLSLSPDVKTEPIPQNTASANESTPQPVTVTPPTTVTPPMTVTPAEASPTQVQEKISNPDDARASVLGTIKERPIQ